MSQRVVADLEYRPPRNEHEAAIARILAWEPSRLLGLPGGLFKRLIGTTTWMPPSTLPLTRYEADDEQRFSTALGQPPVPGWHVHFHVGVVHVHRHPGTRRLFLDTATGEYGLTDDENRLPAHVRDLGFVEQAPLPMLDPLERCVLPDGQEVLVSAPEDPLRAGGRIVAHLGWVDSFPINPRHAVDERHEWGMVPLHRVLDRGAWRHRYVAEPMDTGPRVEPLGIAWAAPLPGGLELRLTADGTLETDAIAPLEARPEPRAVGRWAAAPLAYSRRPRIVHAKAAASRVQQVRARGAAFWRPRPPARGGERIGYLRSTPAETFSPLFSARHPVLGDQLVTRSEWEAHDLGYRVEGVLGYAMDPDPAVVPSVRADVPWAARFGQGRRTWPGAVAAR